ncbi:MAG: iron-containing alcohol dehydrogenase, partial [Oscillospiraceae bacterium]
MEFSFYTANKIVFKQGAIAELGSHVKSLGTNFLVVVDPFFLTSPTMDVVKSQLESIGAAYTVFGEVSGEPTVEQIDEVAKLALKNGCNAVISIGGGSCIDAGKATAALLTNGTPAIDYMEVVGKGKKVTVMPAPFIAVPTTAGTGSEVTKNAVLGSSVLNFKRSMRSDTMVANVAILDPLLTVGCPPKVTANSGIDAATHLIESYLTWRATPISDGLAMSGIELIGKYLRKAYDNGNDIEAREGMCAASLIGGMAFANSGLGAVHGIGMAVGIAFHVPHGEACGILLP